MIPFLNRKIGGDLEERRRSRLLLQICHVANAEGGETGQIGKGGAATALSICLVRGGRLRLDPVGKGRLAWPNPLRQKSMGWPGSSRVSMSSWDGQRLLDLIAANVPKEPTLTDAAWCTNGGFNSSCFGIRDLYFKR